MKNNKVLNDCGLRNRGIDLLIREVITSRNDIDNLWLDLPDNVDDLIRRLHCISADLTSIYCQLYKVRYDAM